MPFKAPPKRATVSRDFVDLWFDWMKATYLKMKNEVDYAGRVREAILRKNGPTMGRIMNLMKNKDALDLELTRLRSFSFESFDAEEHNGVAYFKALTRRIEMIVDDNRDYTMTKSKPHDIYDIGQYTVYIPRSIDREGINSRHLHFIPMEDPLLIARFPHHVASSRGVWMNNAGHIQEANPLDAPSAVCWGGGGFPAIITGIVGEAALVDLMANAHLFLSRCNTSSLLASPFEWAAPHKKFLRTENANQTTTRRRR